MEPGEEIAGWVIERELGVGGMGQVFLARHPRLPRLDAIKVLSRELGADEGFRQRFFRESELVCGLIHPHVVTVYDRGEYDGLLYFAMQYVSGGDLRQRLNDAGRLPVDVALAITGQLASALDAAHENGLVHRDIKPENVLLMPGAPDRPFAVLADFGISRAPSGGTMVTSTGQILATPAYAAPETVRGEPVDGRADQYALGCMLFELLSGEVPFVRDSPMSAFIAHVNDPAPPLPGDPELAQALAPVFSRVLSKQPADRYPTCQDFVAAATEAVAANRSTVPGAATQVVTRPSEQAVTAPPASPEPSQALPGRRRRWPLVATVLVVVAALIAVGIVVGVSGGGGAKAAKSALPAAVGYTPKYVPIACPADVQDDVTGATCGTLTVPQDRSKPAGAQVKLLVTRAPARGKVTSDPVIDFGADDLGDSPVRDHAQEIQLSRRGYAPSVPVLTCPEYAKIAPDALTLPSGDPAVATARRNALEACYHRLVQAGIDPNMFNYYAAADDVLDLMRALRLTRVNLAGNDTDTVSVLRLDHLAPGAVDTISLQDPVLPGESASTDPTQYLADAFDSYAQLCQADTGCRQFGNLATRLAALYASYAKSPALTEGDNGGGLRHQVRVDGGRVAQAIATELDDPRALPLLAGAIALPRGAMLDSLLAGGVVAYDAALLQPDYPWGAVLSEECSYDVFTVSQAHGLAAQTRLELSGVDEDGEFDCGAWKVDQLPAAAFNPKVGVDAPTLIAQGGLSPFSSQTWGRQLVRETFSDGTVATFPTLGALNPANEPTCLADLRRQLIAQRKIGTGVSACEAKSPTITFVAAAH